MDDAFRYQVYCEYIDCHGESAVGYSRMYKSKLLAELHFRKACSQNCTIVRLAKIPINDDGPEYDNAVVIRRY